MCTTNLPAFAFSILPITVVPQCLTHYIFAFKKREYTRQSVCPQRFKDLSVYYHWHWLQVKYDSYQEWWVFSTIPLDLSSAQSNKARHDISRLNKMIKLQAVLWQTITVMDFYECQNRVL